MAKRKRAKSRVYRDAEMLLDEVISVTENFPRQCKYTVGERLQLLCIDQLLGISAAYEAHGNERKAAAGGRASFTGRTSSGATYTSARRAIRGTAGA